MTSDDIDHNGLTAKQAAMLYDEIGRKKPANLIEALNRAYRPIKGPVGPLSAALMGVPYSDAEWRAYLADIEAETQAT